MADDVKALGLAERLEDAAAGWRLVARADGRHQVVAHPEGPHAGDDFAALLAAREGGGAGSRAAALHGTPTAERNAVRVGRALARELAGHRRAIDGDAAGEGARPPEGDDWNELDAILKGVTSLVAALTLSLEDGTHDPAVRRGAYASLAAFAAGMAAAEGRGRVALLTAPGFDGPSEGEAGA